MSLYNRRFQFYFSSECTEAGPKQFKQLTCIFFFFFSFLRSEKLLPKAWGQGTNCLSWYLFLLFLSNSKFWEVEAFAECRYGQVLCTIFWVCLYIKNVIFCCFFFHFCIYASVVYSYLCAGNATWLCFRGPSTRARPEFLNCDIWNKLCLSSQIMISLYLFIAFVVFFMRLELVNCGVVREWLPWTWLKMSAWCSGQWEKD